MIILIDENVDVWYNVKKQRRKKKVKKKIILILTLLSLTMVLSSCNGVLTTKNNDEYSYNDDYESKGNFEDKPVDESELPSELYFMNAMEPHKDEDGNYYFDGYIVRGSLSEYDSGMTVTIKGKNGRELSSGDQSISKHSFNSVNGCSYNIGESLLNNDYRVTEVLFRFIYNSDGDLVEMQQLSN